MKLHCISLCLYVFIDRVKSICADERCENWCENHPAGWEDKCQWSQSCEGCSQCGICRVWCATNPTPWKSTADSTNNENSQGNSKCDWTQSCSGCPECAQEAPPAISPAPATTNPCQNWCANHPKSWSEKCEWRRNCSGCPNCATSSLSPFPSLSLSSSPSLSPSLAPTSPPPSLAPIKMCEPWCVDDPRPWRDEDENQLQKCFWSNCSGCSPCTPPSDAPSTPPSPAPTKVCQEWCIASFQSVPWRDEIHTDAPQKCEWSPCGGCQQCAPPSSPPSEFPSFSSSPTLQPSLPPSAPPSSSPNGIPSFSSSPTLQSSLPPSAPPSSSPSGIPSFSSSPTLQPSLLPSGPTPAPTKGCRQWCVNHPQPWTVKCRWPVNCGGCAECDNHFIQP